ncbi:parallel beta helix pectate lyase-like protein [Pseudonocardia hierapolitana]|uniref:Parallel beta helix pectate lyase-like protein n=1 Tax=Pseudonocardia hierapolitana TaxID=1128676 RepID=A0A561SMD6_9PSEU|nr:right-handed parallel beta-helix repeat-containing protein [Pseudonocardia hierapolitana]TWF76027.1 parallel beta helix pectate lyase-like protein [Pseudonocardia hierapolitana]
MTSSRNHTRGLARIILASLAIGALTLPVTAGSAAAATAGNAVAQSTPPGGSDTGGSATDPGGDGSGSGSDPGGDGGGSGGGSDPGDGGGSGGGSGGGNTNPDPDPPRAVTPRPTGPSQQELEEKRQQEEQRKAEEKAAKEAAEAARKAEEKRLKEIERQRREAAERAEQAAKARASWDERGRPRQMVTIRTDRVEVVDNGRLTTLVPRRPGSLDLQGLDRMLPADWITIDGDTATVNTAIVLTPGVNFEIADIPTVKLTGGPEVPDASAIYTGSGRLTLKNTTLSGVDRGGQQLPMDAVGRPFLEAAGGGEINATDVTITDMGVPEHGQATAEPAVGFNPGSTGSLVRTTLQRNNVGVEVSKAQGVQLDGLTVTESEGDGIVLNGDRGTRMANLRAEKNGGNGMFVGGDNSDRPISGLTTLNNKLYGLVVTVQKGTKISGISTEADEAGGLRLNQVENVTVTDFAATDQPIGIFTHVGSTGIVLDNVRTNGGRRGVVVEKSTTNLELKNSTIEGARVAGVNVGGKEIQVNGVQITDAKAGVRVERGAAHVKLTGTTIDGGRDGVVSSPGAQDVTITDLTANNVEDGAIRLGTPHAVVSGGTINGGATGIQVTGPATITAVAINGPSAGMRVRSSEMVRAENVAIEATDLGLDVSPGSQMVLANSSVHALEAVRGVFTPEGANNISLPPLNLLAAMGVPLILLAIVLEQVHSFRQRKVGGNKKRLPPAIPVGAG